MGAGEPAPDFAGLTPAFLLDTRTDLTEYGRRRESVCEKLREKAVRLAWERGTLVEVSEDNMACCHLLEMLEGRESDSPRPRGKHA